MVSPDGSRYVPSCGSAEVVEASWKALVMAAEMTVDCHLAERICASARRDVPPALSGSQGLSAPSGPAQILSQALFFCSRLF